MTPERWQQVEHVCQEALDLPAAEREAFLGRACRGDADLRWEVESLLKLQPEADGLLDHSAWEAAAEALGRGAGAPQARMEPGQRLGPFEVETLIGTGGMGEVYRARDTRLGRTVAVKVLPHDVAADPDRRRRLDTEARAASALQHPNICALHDIGADGGVDYLVMEYLEGETLARRMARRREAGESLPSGVSIDEALEYGAQIADALAAAHGAGIIHRDLKPGNVMLTRDGVKLLDFGLAKMKPPVEPLDASADGRGQPRTVSGIVMGTMNYLAPEQLTGGKADARSDIFAFGTLLYEMLTGRRAFEGSSPATVIPAILEREPPPLSGLQPLAPPALDQLVRSCLTKDREKRCDSAERAAREIRRIAADRRLGLPRPRALGGWRRWLPWSLAVASAVTAAATVLWPVARPGPPRRPMLRIDLDLGRGYRAHPRDGHAVLSPDGSRIVFAGLGAGGAPDFFVRRLDRAGSMPLGTGGGRDPFVSPDGQWLGYFQGQRLWKIRVTGGRPLELCAVEEDAAHGADWGDDGFIVGAFGPTGGLQRVPEVGGLPMPLTTPDVARREAWHGWPQVLPGSRTVIFTARAPGADSGISTIDAVSVASGRRTTLQRDGEFGRYLPSGHLVFVRRSTLFAARMDAARLEVTGPPVPILGPVAFDEAAGRLHVSVAATGDALVLTGGWRDAEGAGLQDESGSGTAATLLVGFLDELRRVAPPRR